MSSITQEQTQEAERQAGTPSARKLLVDWANGQDPWVRMLVGEILSSREELSRDALDAVFNLYMAEKNLVDEAPATVDRLGLDEGADRQTAEFVIDGLSGVRGVNALVENQKVEFNGGLTILFGENGSGKTGYTRILKRLGAVRTAERILPNVHDPPAAGTKPEATLNYTVGGERKTLNWTGEEGVSPFTYVSIFDSPAVRLHVDDDLSYIYTPGDLALFPRVTAGINQIRARLEEALEKRRPESNPFLSHFTRGTPVYTMIETLGGATDLDALKQLATVREAEETQVKTLATQVAALQGETVAAQLTVARSRRALNEGLAEVGEAILAFDAEAYNQAVGNATAADTEYAKLRQDLVASVGLEGDGEEAWQDFVLMGEEYRKHLEDHGYPQDGDACLYCRQPLEQAAAQLLRRYQDFANDASRKRAQDSRGIAATLCRDLAGSARAGLAESLAEARTDGDGDSARDDAAHMLTELAARQEAFERAEPVSWGEIRTRAEKVKKEAETRRQAAEELMATLTTKESERAEELRRKSAEQDSLKDRIDLKRRLPTIATHVEDAQWAQRADQLCKRFRGLLKSLTDTAKVASEDLLNSDFETRFKAECKALRAPDVGLEFPGREGKAARRKTVSASYRPSEILSEGEQKVIALADFLAEASLRLTPAPLVLDDPVSSLDYKRINEVAARVTELAEHRQVIVFTHNIWFAIELLSRFESKREKCSYFSVTDEAGKGVITPGTHPRWDTIKQTRGKINDTIASAGTSEGETREALIERGYSLIRTWCEVAVESELLAGVTQRYAPNVGMTKLPQIKGDHLQTAIGVILPTFEKACRVMEGHSQPLETLAIRPTLDDLERDWKELQGALKAYQDA